MLNILLQEGVEEVVEELDPEATEKTLSIMELLMNGGVAGQVIIAVLFILLFVAVYIYLSETLVQLSRKALISSASWSFCLKPIL